MSDITIDQAQRRVRAFHEKHGFSVNSGIVDDKSVKQLLNIGKGLRLVASSIQEVATTLQKNGDDRLWRVMLSLEELGEWCEALYDADEESLADALADRQYVLLGDAVATGFPLQELFHAVADSNDTKASRRPEEPRMRDKGPDYRPPDILGALERGRERLNWESRLQNENV